MRSVHVSTNGLTSKVLAELNHHKRDEQKEVRNGVAGEGQGLSEEDESRINEDGEDVNCRRIELVEAQAVLPRPQQQPQGPLVPVVQWERFLPLRSLKVLLVEYDDSTRHVVSALLRNCSYEVTAVANGLEAWKILGDITNHIDLVLTEVVMPYLSGIGLLSKIMNHQTCKNIPVIMMSSNDSMGIVFKCLSKGAVDFLVKPVRKNELKNLWQHIWRKCHSSSGSGSESGIRTQKSIKLKSDEGSDNNTGSNDEDDNGSVGPDVRDGSDNGSGTQSSWTKRAVVVDSPKPPSAWQQLANPPASTRAQGIHSKLESNNWVPTTATGKYQEQNDENGKIDMGKDLEIGIPRISELQFEDPTKRVVASVEGINTDKIIDVNSKKDAEKLELNSGIANQELMEEVANLTDVTTNDPNPQTENFATQIPKDVSKNSNIKDKTIYDTTEDIPTLALSLKRTRNFVGDTGSNLHERNVLRHSDLSAFSRYNTTSIANLAPTGNVGSCSPLDISSEAAKTESVQHLQSKSNCTLYQPSNGSSNNNDMGSTTNNAIDQPASFTDKPMPKSAVNQHPCSAFQPVQNGHVSSLQPVTPGKPDAATVKTSSIQATGTHQQVQVQHHHHHYHHHHHHVHNNQKKQQLEKHDDLALRNNVAAPQYGPSNMLGTPVEGNAANYSLIKSTSGSNYGSKQSGGSTAVTAGGDNMVTDNGMAGISDAACGSGSGSRSGLDQNRSALREAALNKFRQKRKERCFEKKVRYQSRQKLAEQRPRVRGQFVRQVAHENKSNDTYS